MSSRWTASPSAQLDLRGRAPLAERHDRQVAEHRQRGIVLEPLGHDPREHQRALDPLGRTEPVEHLSRPERWGGVERADGDGKRTSAFDYARRLVPDAEPNVPKVLDALRDYDEAVAAQMASRLQARGVALHDVKVRDGTRKAGPHVERGFQAFSEAWRESQIARSQAPLK